MQEYGELDAKDYIPGAEILEVEKEEENAENDEGLFLFIIIKDKTTPIFLLTLKSVCCLNIQSADIYWAMTTDQALFPALELKHGFCS